MRVTVSRIARRTCSFRTRRAAVTLSSPPRTSAGRNTAPVFAIVVPFREQREQDRAAQLRRFHTHMSGFLRGARYLIVVVQQSHDSRAFNRGQLLNVGFAEAKRQAAPAPLAAVILHDVDLLPPPGLLPWYIEPPIHGRPTHIAAPSTWRKYAMPGCAQLSRPSRTHHHLVMRTPHLAPPTFARCSCGSAAPPNKVG